MRSLPGMLAPDILQELQEATVATGPQLELRVADEHGSWRVLDPAALVPEHVDADLLAQWRKRAT